MGYFSLKKDTIGKSAKAIKEQERISKEKNVEVEK
jgi:hypothetical protein